jgi:hypothetical protein
MPATFSCGECGYQAKVKDELSGKKIKCPKCQTVGLVGGGRPTASAKRPEDPSSEGMSTIAGLNLDAYKDLVPEEGDPDFADPKEEVKPKRIKKIAAPKTGGVSPAVKLATTIFVLLSLLTIAGLGFFVWMNMGAIR